MGRHKLEEEYQYYLLKQKDYDQLLWVCYRGPRPDPDLFERMCGRDKGLNEWYAAMCKRMNADPEELIRQRRYADLFEKLCTWGTDEEAKKFIELAEKDKGLRLWYAKKQVEMLRALTAPENVEKSTEYFKAAGFGEMFEFMKNVQEFGFASMEEIEKATGVSIAEQLKFIEENPEMKKHVFSMTEN
jgi:hypothetical protein